MSETDAYLRGVAAGEATKHAENERLTTEVGLLQVSLREANNSETKLRTENNQLKKLRTELEIARSCIDQLRSDSMELRAALEPFARKFNAESLFIALAHITREDLQRASDAMGGKS